MRAAIEEAIDQSAAGPHGFDEVYTSQKSIRPHWQPFFEHAPTLNGPEFGRRWHDARRIIRENGVTYNVYGDPHGLTRPWQLDPIPFLLPPDEAAFLERGLIQRARLLEQILSDVYGEQHLLREGHLPHELLFRNPLYLRPCHGIRPALGRYMHLYAANLARDGSGRWHVISDRTQCPSGAGYTLENRIVVSRTLPEAFQNCRVQRLALFFQSLITSLRSIAPRNKENPRVVLLTPGPYNETYFEHSYLARYLGYTLVEGGDMTVRDNRVYLKVLGSLQPVDVIFRRLDDDYCDPLELRPDSFLGVPGLLHAVRSGNVAVANAIGSGVIESPALLAYLPKLCRRILGEDLLLDTVRTWWCGDPNSLDYVLSHLGDLVVKPAFPGANRSRQGLEQQPDCTLAERLRAYPHAYVAQERLPLSLSPTLSAYGIQNRKTVLRMYVAAQDDSFAVMPGGLTRFGSSPDNDLVSMQHGGGSKDTWVLTDGAVSLFSLLPAQDGPVQLTRGGGDIPSRAADNLYWLGRYAERAESLARLLRCIVTRLAERSSLIEVPELQPLERAVVAHTDGRPKALSDILAVVTDLNHGGLAGVTRDLHRVAGLVRDRLSLDMWRVISRTVRESRTDDRVTYADALDELDTIILRLAAFGGMAIESMTRTDGWRFLDLGRKIERALHLLKLIRETLATVTTPESNTLDAVIEICDSRMTYRRRYLGALRIESVLDLILFDETNPRSLAALLAGILDDVNHLPRSNSGLRDADQRLALTSISILQLSDVEKLSEAKDDKRIILGELIEILIRSLLHLSDSLTQQYLSHLQESRHLSGDPRPVTLGEGEDPFTRSVR